MNHIKILTHFLLVNYEMFIKGRLEQKLVLLYFLFRTAEKFDKPHYAHFAFDRLKVVLASEFRKIKSNKSDATILIVGRSVIQFSLLGFVERDSLGIFLNSFDGVASRMTKELVQNVNKQRLSKILVIVEYLQERNQLCQVNDSDINIPYTLMVAAQIRHTVLKKQSQIDLSIAERSYNFFKLHLDTKKQNEICCSGLRYLNNLTSMRPNEILKEYIQNKDNANLKQLIRYEIYFPEILRDTVNSGGDLKETIAEEAEKIINTLYSSKNLNATGAKYKLLLCAIGSFPITNDAAHRRFLIQNLDVPKYDI